MLLGTFPPSVVRNGLTTLDICLFCLLHTRRYVFNTFTFLIARVTGFEPISTLLESGILPLNYTRIFTAVDKGVEPSSAHHRWQRFSRPSAPTSATYQFVSLIDKGNVYVGRMRLELTLTWLQTRASNIEIPPYIRKLLLSSVTRAEGDAVPIM